MKYRSLHAKSIAFSFYNSWDQCVHTNTRRTDRRTDKRTCLNKHGWSLARIESSKRIKRETNSQCGTENAALIKTASPRVVAAGCAWVRKSFFMTDVSAGLLVPVRVCCLSNFVKQSPRSMRRKWHKAVKPPVKQYSQLREMPESQKAKPGELSER